MLKVTLSGQWVENLSLYRSTSNPYLSIKHPTLLAMITMKDGPLRASLLTTRFALSKIRPWHVFRLIRALSGDPGDRVYAPNPARLKTIPTPNSAR